MTLPDPKDTLVEYLQTAREALLWKLDGLDEHDVRRPLTPTGTNLLGLVKHVASVELGYFGDTFGRPSPVPLPWHADDADPNEDLWVPASESRDFVVGLYRTAWAHAAETFASHDLASVGRVPWWPAEDAAVTLHQVLVHTTTETYRHAGHADILRELIDGSAGRRAGDPNLDDGYDWPGHVARVAAAARDAADPQLRH
ncbi:DinB family protein [Nocardioides sp. 1609]|uniref:DinB family protein n=1 Tax=Nocardioides sp. 1609 TaxID=2508327 RepID=UPI00106FE7D7|nr:DinB family protein [Nocardioides sp. 1609]